MAEMRSNRVYFVSAAVGLLDGVDLASVLQLALIVLVAKTTADSLKSGQRPFAQRSVVVSVGLRSKHGEAPRTTPSQFYFWLPHFLK